MLERLERYGGAEHAAVLRLAAACAALFAAAVVHAQHATAYDVESGARAYESSCANCHGPDGNLIADIDFGRGLFRRSYTDAELASIIMHGIPDTPMPPNPDMSEAQALELVAYLRSLPSSASRAAGGGDRARGRALFEGKGGCLDCHRVAGRGSRSGPPLTRIGLERRAVELERSLRAPEAEVLPENRSYEITRRDGRVVRGRLLNHDTFTVQLIDADGRLRSFVKSELRDYGFTDTPMPSYDETLDDDEIADLVSYLVSLQGDAPP